MAVFIDLKNRQVADVFSVCDGLNGLPDSVTTTWPQTTAQACIFQWDEFIQFLDYGVEFRKVISSTNVIESLNAGYRRAVKARGYFSTDQAALKYL